jgi:hypothetical protein
LGRDGVRELRMARHERSEQNISVTCSPRVPGMGGGDGWCRSASTTSVPWSTPYIPASSAGSRRAAAPASSLSLLDASNRLQPGPQRREGCLVRAAVEHNARGGAHRVRSRDDAAVHVCGHATGLQPWLHVSRIRRSAVGQVDYRLAGRSPDGLRPCIE